MQAETAVKWLKQVAEEIRAEGHAGWGNTLDDVCALLAGKVLCDAEPVAVWVTPLYAPASPLGNASLAGNADIGKVQGAFDGQPPCNVCGYNGPGFYQPSTHACSGKEGGE